METTKNKPLASPKADAQVGNGMSKREARKIRMKSMNKSEIAYMRRKRVFEAVWPFFRFFILFGLCFVILYPLIYMISCAFRDPTDMSDPTLCGFLVTSPGALSRTPPMSWTSGTR